MSSNTQWRRQILCFAQGRAGMNAIDSRHGARKLRLIVARAESEVDMGAIGCN
jgi:hypothetical protein